MDARSKRREATRRQLEQQLRERQAREARRKRVTLISSIGGTIVLIAAVIVLVVALNSGSDKKPKAASSPSANANATSATSGAPTSAASSPPAAAAPTTPCAKPDGKATASFSGVTVGEATNLKHEPKVSSKGATTPANLTCMDLVTGKGAAAKPTSNVTVQYTGVLYKDGKKFDSSWARKQTAQFSLAQVVPGFTEGIGGAGKVAPMKVGGRRIMILPPALGYGAQAQSGIPANSTLVFVVDLVKVG